MVNKLVAALLLTASLSFSTGQASVVTWGAATTVSGDADVNTSGALVGAVNLSGGAILPPNETVNGVSFTSWDASIGTKTSGIFSFGQSTVGSQVLFLNPAGPFGSLSPDYQDVLRDFGVFANGASLNISGLTIGQTYLFQWWSTVPNPDNPNLNASGTAAAGNSVTLDPNLSNAAGGLGQYAIGSFTADNATQTIAFSAGSTISAMQVRLPASSRSVPDSGTTLALFGLALASLVGVRRRLQR